jgi:hypothetical protein
MTTNEARELAQTVLPGITREALSAESLVRRCFETAYCTEFEDRFEVYGDGILIGESPLGPIYAWIDAAQNLPYLYLTGFDTKRGPAVHNFPDALRVFYVKKEEPVDG